MGLAREIAEFVVDLDESRTPVKVQQKISNCLLNGYGMALGSAETPFYKVAARAAIGASTEAGGGATLMFSGMRAPLSDAVVSNAALFHGRAQEDTCGTVHVGAITIPLITAMLESGKYSIARLKSALLAAYEVSGFFDRPFGRITAGAGLRATPLYGTLGAAAAAGKLMGLSVDRMEATLANAASFTGGILQSFAQGTDEWRYQAGVAARNGYIAAALAQAGSVAASEAFEGEAGFLRAYVRAKPDTLKPKDLLGIEWSIARTTFKPHPVCAFNQTPVIAAIGLRNKLQGRLPVRIRVRMNPFEMSYAGMDATGPFASIAGTLMSIPFCIATTLIYGAPNLRQMTTYCDPKVIDLIGKTVLVSDETVPNLSAVIEVELEEGDKITQSQNMTYADYDLSWQEVSRLVRRVGGEQGVPAEVYERLEDFVVALPNRKIEDVIDLFSLR